MAGRRAKTRWSSAGSPTRSPTRTSSACATSSPRTRSARPRRQPGSTYQGRDASSGFLGRLPEGDERDIRLAPDRRARVRLGAAAPYRASGTRNGVEARPRRAPHPHRRRARPRGARAPNAPADLRLVLVIGGDHDTARFADASYRIEISSVAGRTRCAQCSTRLAAHDIPVRRGSQGAARLTHRRRNGETLPGAEHGVEVSLCLAPARRPGTPVASPRRRPSAAVSPAARRAVPAARSSRPAAESAWGSARSPSPISACSRCSDDCASARRAPRQLVLETSVLLPCANPATAHEL